MSAAFAGLSGWSRAGRKGWLLSVPSGVTVDRLSCTLLDLGLPFEHRGGIMCLQSALQLQEALGKCERVAPFLQVPPNAMGYTSVSAKLKRSYFKRNRTQETLQQEKIVLELFEKQHSLNEPSWVSFKACTYQVRKHVRARHISEHA